MSLIIGLFTLLGVIWSVRTFLGVFQPKHEPKRVFVVGEGSLDIKMVNQIWNCCTEAVQAEIDGLDVLGFVYRGQWYFITSDYTTYIQIGDTQNWQKLDDEKRDELFVGMQPAKKERTKQVKETEKPAKKERKFTTPPSQSNDDDDEDENDATNALSVLSYKQCEKFANDQREFVKIGKDLPFTLHKAFQPAFIPNTNRFRIIRRTK